MKTKYIALILIGINTLLAVVSWIVLPAVVKIQFAFDGTANTAPKAFAILIPTVIGVGFGVMAYLGKEEKLQKKYLLTSCIGIIVFILSLVINF